MQIEKCKMKDQEAKKRNRSHATGVLDLHFAIYSPQGGRRVRQRSIFAITSVCQQISPHLCKVQLLLGSDRYL